MQELSIKETSIVYAKEADVLNIALFGKTEKQWKDENPIFLEICEIMLIFFS